MPFDVDAFLNTPFMGQTDSRRAVCPKGRYPAVITKLEPRAPKEEGQRAILEVHCAPQSYQGPPVKYTCWLDLLADGALDFSEFKNGQIGQLRDATNTNWSDRPWTSMMLMGQALQIEVDHRLYNNTMYDQVVAVAPLGQVGATAAQPAAQQPTAPQQPQTVSAPPQQPQAQPAIPAAPPAVAAPVALPMAPQGGNAVQQPVQQPTQPPAAAPQAPAGQQNPWGT